MEITIFDVFIPALLIGLLEIIKMQGVNAKRIPLISIILGIAIGVTYIAPGNFKEGILIGIALGLFCVGFYSTSKNTLEGFGLLKK